MAPVSLQSSRAVIPEATEKPLAPAMKMTNYLTIDVEDYFQVSAFEKIVPRPRWNDYPSRVENNTRKILAILEERGISATFFIVGWIAQKHPTIVRAIADQGHEVACHSYYHRLVYTLSPEEFHEDTKMAKDVLEQITGKRVLGYRAPSYSITRKSLWALHILRDLGFSYDSSIFPIYHDRYGIPDAPRYPFLWDLSTDEPKVTEGTDGTMVLTEYPMSTSMFFGKNIPVCGGGYFRLYPYWLTRKSLQKINLAEKRQFIFYLHPWEFDPEQPRFREAGALSRFRHYNNLAATTSRFHRLLADFSFGPITSPQE